MPPPRLPDIFGHVGRLVFEMVQQPTDQAVVKRFLVHPTPFDHQTNQKIDPPSMLLQCDPSRRND